MTEHEIAQKAFSNNRERLKAERLGAGGRGAEGNGKGLMKQSDLYRLNAENCAQMAEAAESEPAHNRFRRS